MAARTSRRRQAAGARATAIVAGSTIFGTKDYKTAIAAIRANACAGAAKQAMPIAMR